jgi:hypothetical protein
VRSPERTLTIVFPPFVDADGVLHDEATAHAVVEAPRWASAPMAGAHFSRSPAPSSLREAVAGASAPAAEGLESLPAQAPHPLPESAGAPSAEAVRAAREGHRIKPARLDMPTLASPAGAAPLSAAAPPHHSATDGVSADEGTGRKAVGPEIEEQQAGEALFRPTQPQDRPR